MELDYHEAANIFPLDEEHVDELAEDIKRHGQREPIALMNGQILDGRRRAMACERVGVPPKTKTIHTDDPIAYVLSLNLMRRQLTVSQRAMVAARVLELHKQAAKERQRQSPGRGKKGVTTSTHLSQTGKSRDTAGAAVGVGGFSVDRARRVLERGTEELIEAVDKGKITVNSAAKIADLPQEKQLSAIDDAVASSRTSPIKNGAPKRKTLRRASDEPLDDQEERQRTVAVEKAHDAIAILTKIPANNPYRFDAWDMVARWIKDEKRRLQR